MAVRGMERYHRQIPASRGRSAGDASHLPSELGPAGFTCGISALPGFSPAVVDARVAVFGFLRLRSPSVVLVALTVGRVCVCRASVSCLAGDSKRNS